MITRAGSKYIKQLADIQYTRCDIFASVRCTPKSRQWKQLLVACHSVIHTSKKGNLCSASTVAKTASAPCRFIKYDDICAQDFQTLTRLSAHIAWMLVVVSWHSNLGLCCLGVHAARLGVT